MATSLSNVYTQLLDAMPYTYAALLVESLLFGIHFVLFFVMLSIFVIFVISLADVAISYRWGIYDVPSVLKLVMSPLKAAERVAIPKGIILIADGLLAYRCYKVWDSRVWILAVAGTILLADSIWGYICMKGFNFLFTFAPVFLWSVFAFNIVMCLLTGRIWWVGRRVQPYIDNNQMQTYRAAIAIILESGAVYPMTILIFILIPASKLYR
ncbi:hypothetical protein H0H92_010260, partial [Tricholoma furcatifolium]